MRRSSYFVLYLCAGFYYTFPSRTRDYRRYLIKAGTKKTHGWLLYILRCCDGSLYTGITNDIDRRVEQHNSGTASRYTRSRLPVVVLHRERCLNRSSALKKECRIKALTRMEKEEYIGKKARSATKSPRLKKAHKFSAASG